MATQSVQTAAGSGTLPLGLISVAAAGTPVAILSLLDPTNIRQLQAPQIMFQAAKAGAAHGIQANTGNVYIMVKGVQGAGNRDDYGSMVAFLTPGQTLVLASSPRNNGTFNAISFFIDGDNNGDGCIVTLIH